MMYAVRAGLILVAPFEIFACGMRGLIVGLTEGIMNVVGAWREAKP